VDICQVTKDAVAIVQASVSRKITIVRDVTDQCPAIQADVGQVQQLMLNLILNAAEAIGDKKGEVSIRVRIRDVPAAELTRLYAEFPLPSRPYTEVQVRDTGAGMDEATLNQIFDPFFTTKFMGRGLGLAAALGIVRSHGGGIAVESSPGKGTTFTVLLPAEQDMADAPMTVSDSITEAARGEGLVLVADDEVAIRSLIQQTLEELGYTVLTAEHGAQALELFDRVGKDIELVLLDLVMPVLDGAETAVALHSRQPDVPILVMSGISDDDALRRFSDVRIAGFVPKPFAPDQLAQAVAVARQREGRASTERKGGKTRDIKPDRGG
jgi:CheY-like chemotaxis protein